MLLTLLPALVLWIRVRGQPARCRNRRTRRN